jgi:integrase
MGLGSLTTVGLSEARDAARECRRLLAGTPTIPPVDPIEHRRALRAEARIARAKAMSFRQCAEAYIATHQAGWRNPKHAAQWPATLVAYVYPVFGDLPVEAVDTGLVMKAPEPIWTTKPETASRVRGRIEAVLDWAKTAGYRHGENPARWRGHLENLLMNKASAAKAARRASGRKEHHAALHYKEIGAFVAKLRAQEGVTARALEFLILTAARTGEVIGARWGEFDLTERIWTVPAERMKAGKEHRVPLSSAVLAILEKMRAMRDGEFVFSGGKTDRPLSNMAMLMLLRRMGAAI